MKHMIRNEERYETHSDFIEVRSSATARFHGRIG